MSSRPAPLPTLLLLLVAVGLALVGVRVLLGAWRATHPPRVSVRTLADRPELAGFREVTARAADGVELAGWWKEPENGAAVLLVHGIAANREQMLPQALALSRLGFGVLVVDLRAHGASGGSLATWGDRERLDVEAWVDVLSSRATVRAGAIGVVGFSIGALAVVGAAEADPRIGAVVLEAMHPSLDSEIRTAHSAHGVWSEVAWLAAMRSLGVRIGDVRSADSVCRLAPRPLLLVYGDGDAVAPPAIGEPILRRACGPAWLEVVPCGGHGKWTRAGLEQLSERMGALFGRALLR